MDRDALVAAIESLDAVMIGATLIVAVGVVGELSLVLKEGWRQRIFTALVAIGVLGEFGVAYKERTLGMELHSIEAQDNRDLQVRLEGMRGDSQKQAQEADERDKTLNVELTQARAEIAKAEDAADEANAHAKADELARVQLEHRVAPRHLSPEQQTRVYKKIDPYGGQKLEFVFTADIFEEAQLASDILAPLTKAVWIVSVIRGSNASRTFRGVLIEVRPDSLPANKDAAQALANTLRDDAKLEVLGPFPWQDGAAQAVITPLGPQRNDSPVRITIGSR